MIVAIDTETTGLLKPNAAPLKEQPKIIEIFCRKFDLDGNVVENFHSMINPEIPVPELITKITGIKDNDVKDSPIFVEIYKDLAEFFVGCKYMTGHNLGFDRDMLANELLRIDQVCSFPWPPVQICSVVASFNIRGYRLSLDKLYKELFQKDRPGIKHRAENDVKDQIECFFELIKRGNIIL
jgi:DNA polymerase III epsilon subunit-like protein